MLGTSGGVAARAKVSHTALFVAVLVLFICYYVNSDYLEYVGIHIWAIASDAIYPHTSCSSPFSPLLHLIGARPSYLRRRSQSAVSLLMI